MEIVVARTFIILFWFLRVLFLSSKAGSFVHNLILVLINKLIPARFGFETPDLPEIGKVLRDSRWRTSTTYGFVLKNYTLNPRFKSRLMENLIAWRNAVGYIRRRKLTKKGYLIPSHLFLSPTYSCNLNCKGCYAKGHEGEELSLLEIDKIAEEQERLGIFDIYIFGGEPFLREDLWQIYAKYPRTIFDIFTNGTLLDESEIDKIANLGNIRLFISMEGFKSTTDQRRGDGVYDRVIKTLRICQKKRIYYGVSVTVGKENFDEVTSKEFVDMLSGLGILVISYVLYMPCGREDGFFSEPTKEQISKLERMGDYIQDNYPIFPVIGKNGSDSVTSCSAAKGRIHITANGDVEPCVFCQFAVDNIRGKKITDVMNSEFFQIIRVLNGAGVSHFNPCKVYKSPLLQSYFRETGAHSTIKKEGDN